MKRWLTAAVVALSAVLAGGAAPASRPDFDLDATVARFDALHRRIAGNLAEHRASELLNYHRVEGGVQKCMRARGRTYHKPPFVSFYRDFTDADLGFGNGSASIIDSLTAGTRRWELNAIAGARAARAGAHERTALTGDVELLNTCAAPYEYRMFSDWDPPANVYQLSHLDDLMTSIYRDPTVVRAWRGYPACMKSRHRYVIDGDRSDFLFGPSAKLQQPPVDGAPAGPGWHRAVAELRAVFAADADCRRPAYVAAMRLVHDRLDAWEVRHRTELRSIRTAWRQRVSAAAQL